MAKYDLVDENENNKNENTTASYNNGDTYFDDGNVLRTYKNWWPDLAVGKDDFDAGLMQYFQKNYGESPTDEQKKQLTKDLEGRGYLQGIYGYNKMANTRAPNTEKWFESIGINPFGKTSNNNTAAVSKASIDNSAPTAPAPADANTQPAASAATKKESNTSASNNTNASGFTIDKAIDKNKEANKKAFEANKEENPAYLEDASEQAGKVNDLYKAFVEDIKKYWRKPLVLDLLGAGAGKDGEWSIKDRWSSLDKDGKRKFDGSKFARNMHYLLNAIGTVAQTYGAALQGKDPSAYQADYVKDQNKMANAYLDRVNKIHDAGANAAGLIGKQAESNIGFNNLPREVSGKIYGLIRSKVGDIDARNAALGALNELGKDISNLDQEDWNNITSAMVMTANNPNEALGAGMKGLLGKTYTAVSNWAEGKGFKSPADFFKWMFQGNSK